MTVEPRRFRHTARVELGDAAVEGRVRFDALARFLQDAAFADVEDAGFAGSGAWVVRRTRLDVTRFPRFREPVELTTWCSGLGRMWAERTTTIGDAITAVALWVFVDPESGRPLPLDPAQLPLWETSAQGRTIRARLHHPSPPETTDITPWRFRTADLDVAQHVNNAAYWTVLEELVPAPPEPCTAEIEFRGGAQAGPGLIKRHGEHLWICGADGNVCASVRMPIRLPPRTMHK